MAAQWKGKKEQPTWTRTKQTPDDAYPETQTWNHEHGKYIQEQDITTIPDRGELRNTCTDRTPTTNTLETNQQTHALRTTWIRKMDTWGKLWKCNIDNCPKTHSANQPR